MKFQLAKNFYLHQKTDISVIYLYLYTKYIYKDLYNGFKIQIHSDDPYIPDTSMKSLVN